MGLSKIKCYFVPHDYETVHCFRGVWGEGGGIVRREQVCRRCGHSRVLMDLDADLVKLVKSRKCETPSE